MTAHDEPSVFSRIIAREIPADVVYEDEQLIAFRDINPQAPVHLLVVPKTEKYEDVVSLAAGDPALLAQMISVAKELAERYANGQFRLVFNSGPDAGQTVFHVHAHILAGGLSEGRLA